MGGTLPQFKKSAIATDPLVASLFDLQSKQLDRIEALLISLEHNLISNDPNDGTISLLEALNIQGEAVGDLSELVVTPAIAPIAPAEPEQILVERSPTLQTFGRSLNSGGTVSARSAWDSGYYSSVADYGIIKPGEWIEFTPSGPGVYGLTSSADYANFAISAAAVFLENQTEFNCVSETMFVKRAIAYETGRRVRLTITDTGIQWATIENGLVIPAREFPIKVSSPVSPWGLLGSNGSRVSSVRLAKFENAT